MTFNKEDMIDFFIDNFDSIIGENIEDFAYDLEYLDFNEINEPNGNFYYELDFDSEKTDAIGQFVNYFDTVFFTKDYFMEYYTTDFVKTYNKRLINNIIEYLANLYGVYLTDDFLIKNAELMYDFYTENKIEILETLFKKYHDRIIYVISSIDVESPY